MLLQRGWIPFCLLQNTLHDGILQDAHNLGVALDALHRLFLRLPIATGELCLEGLLLQIFDFARVGSSFVVFHRFGADVGAFVVFFHSEVGLCLAEVGTDEFRVALNGFVTVAHCAGEGHEFDKGGGAV